MFERKPLIDIGFLEVAVVLLLLVLVGVVFARRKNIEIKKHPEYRFYLWGVYTKVVGSVVFALIYVYYYGNGDTISFFLSSVPLAKLFVQDPVSYFQAVFSANTVENRYEFFDQFTGYPMRYVYGDSRSYMLVRIISPIVLFSFNSFLISGVILSILAYGGVWKLYRTLVRYYPKLQWQLAVAILFFPSSVFWGSGIIKDTCTFAALCWFVHALDNIFFLRQRALGSWLILVLSAAVIISMKPYIFMTIFPASVLWVLYHRVARLRNVVVRTLFLPVAMSLLVVVTYFTLNSLGDRLQKFSLDNALKTVVTTQKDMKRSEQYGENYFDVGEIEASWGSVLSKFPAASFAGLYRPTLLETNNFVMLLSGLENAWLLLFSIYLLWRSRVVHFLTLIRVNPLLQMCFLFAVGYAFVIGVTTPNFGALVRFKIPLLPFFVSGLFITSHILDRRRSALARGGRFQFDSFANGDPERLLARP